MISKTGRDGRDWILALDTATEQAGVAVLGNSILVERSWPSGRQQTVALLPAVEEMMVEAGIGYDDLGLIAVAIGPGSFTGLRVSLGLAKGIVMAEGCALIGVPTLDILGAPTREGRQRSIAVAPAGRGRVLWAAYPADTSAIGPHNTTFAEFRVALSGFDGWLVLGELSPEQRSHLEGDGVNLVHPARGIRRAGHLAELAQRRWKAGESDDPVGLEPVYVHGNRNPR